MITGIITRNAAAVLLLYHVSNMELEHSNEMINEFDDYLAKPMMIKKLIHIIASRVLQTHVQPYKVVIIW